jgi:protein dithiol oxidoreductase (disulfide-forming)
MLRILLLYLGLCLLSPLAIAADPPFTEGVHYQTVNQPLPTLAAPGQVEVVEMFWYGCPHCYRFEPLLEKWVENKPDQVAFMRVPAVFRDSWLLHGQAFYAAQVLGVLDKIHQPLFDAMHQENRRFQTKEELADFFATQGVSKEEFLATFESFAVQGKIQQAVAVTRNSGITGVPAMIVNGKYRTDATSAGSFEGMLEVVDYLVAEESTAAAAD